MNLIPNNNYYYIVLFKKLVFCAITCSKKNIYFIVIVYSFNSNRAKSIFKFYVKTFKIVYETIICSILYIMLHKCDDDNEIGSTDCFSAFSSQKELQQLKRLEFGGIPTRRHESL